jgi:CheY-like chemotaxis protein
VKFADDLLGDSMRLMQSLINLAGNAIKFTERGSVTLSCKVVEETSDEVLIRFAVRDTGIGISSEAVGRLFTPFEQADGSTTRKYGGTGLGLSITRSLAELMGGQAGGESIEGLGSTFWFTAWLKKAGTHQVVQVENDAKAFIEALRADFAGSVVLLVDDEMINREIAGELLSEVGLVVAFAENGEEAVALCREQRFAMICMDMQMPVMDGLTATAAIRQLPDYATTPILAMTANAFAEDRAICLAAGMDDFIPKPLDPDQVFATIYRCLQAAQALR